MRFLALIKVEFIYISRQDIFIFFLFCCKVDDLSFYTQTFFFFYLSLNLFLFIFIPVHLKNFRSVCRLFFIFPN